MKMRFFHSLLASMVAGAILFSALPISVSAVQPKQIENPYNSDWVQWDGKWYPTGAILDNTDSDLATYSTVNNQNKYTYNPNDPFVDLTQETNYFPPIRSQEHGSCVAFAAVSYQFTYEMAKLNNWNLKAMANNEVELNQHIFSPMHIYNLLHKYVAETKYHSGTSIGKVYKLLQKFGAAKEADFPLFKNNVANVSEWLQNSEAQLNALQYRLSDYEILKFAESSDLTPIDSGVHSLAIQDIKARLQNEQIVSIAVRMSGCTVTLPDNGERAILFGYNYVGEEKGGHQLTIVGYDDTIEYDINKNNVIDPSEKGAFKIANSWGTDWENAGYCWLMYDALNPKSATNVSYENMKAHIKENDNKAPESFEIERFGFISDYTYYCIEVDTYNPVMVAEIRFPLSNELNTNYTINPSVSSQSYANQEPLMKSIPDIDHATFYIDLTPFLREPPYKVENYLYQLQYRNINSDTVGQPVYYKLKYYADNEQDYASSPTLSYKQFTSNGRIQTQNLDLSLQYALSGKSPYTIDETHQFIEVPFGNQAYKFSSSFMGGELVYDLKGLAYVPTGATIEQKFLDRVYGTYSTVLYGDVNGDAAIDQNDVNLLQQYVNGQATLNGPYKEAAHIVRYYYGGTSDAITQRDVDLLNQRINEYKDLSEGYYTFQNSATSLYLEKTSYDGGKAVQIDNFSDSNDQIFKIEPTGDPGYYRIRAAFKPSFVLTCNVNTNNVTLSYQDDDKTKDKQIWSIAYDAKGILFIPYKNPHKALALENGSTQTGTKAKLVSRNNATDTKYWKIAQTVPRRTLADGVYEVINRANAKHYLDAADAGTTNGTQVRAYFSSGDNNQKWFFKYHSEDGYYSIHPIHRPSLCLTVSDSSHYNTVLQWDSNLATQRWFVIAGKNGDFRFAPTSSPAQVLMTEQPIRYSYLELGADNLEGDISNQTKWLITATTPIPTVEEGYYSFINVNSDKYMDVDTHKAGALAPVVQYSEGAYDTQMWHVRLSSDGYYIVSNVYDNRFVLCTDGNRVYLSPEGGSESDSIKWLFIQNEDGSYRLSPKKHPSQAAVVSNASYNDNARLILWDDNLTQNGCWFLDAPTSYADGDYTFTWQDDGMSEPRYMTSGRVFSDSSGGYPYSTIFYNGKYPQYSSWKVEYQGNGYYTIKNNGSYGDGYGHYLSYDGAVVRCEISENPQEDDSIHWIITKEGKLIPKSYPNYAISVYGRSSSDTQLSATNINSKDVICWSMRKQF